MPKTELFVGAVVRRSDEVLLVRQSPGHPEPHLGGVALVYLCTHIGGNLTPQDTETDAARYFSASTFQTLTETKEPWSQWLVQRIFAGRLTLTRSDSTNPLQPKGAFL